jgi:hypothetical protein
MGRQYLNVVCHGIKGGEFGVGHGLLIEASVIYNLYTIIQKYIV